MDSLQKPFLNFFIYPMGTVMIPNTETEKAEKEQVWKLG